MPEPRLPLTPAERADLRQKAEKATPGPWKDGAPAWFRGRTDPEAGKRPITANALGVIGNIYGRGNANYIAAISPDRLLALLDEVERLETTNDRLMVELSLLDRDDEVLKVQP